MPVCFLCSPLEVPTHLVLSYFLALASLWGVLGCTSLVTGEAQLTSCFAICVSSVDGPPYPGLCILSFLGCLDLMD